MLPIKEPWYLNSKNEPALGSLSWCGLQEHDLEQMKWWIQKGGNWAYPTTSSFEGDGSCPSHKGDPKDIFSVNLCMKFLCDCYWCRSRLVISVGHQTEGKSGSPCLW